VARGNTAAKAQKPTDKAATKAKKAPAKAAARAGRKPTRAERAEARRKDQIRKLRARSGNRYLVHYDIDGPRVRLGIAWFIGSIAALAFGPVATALWFGVAFAAAGSHALRTWRARGADVDPRVALGGVAVTVAAAAVHPRAMGVAVLGLAAGAVALALRRLGDGGTGRAVAQAGLVLQAALPTAVAGGCFVLLADLEIWAAVSLVLLVSAYETGDFLVGSGSVSAFEGPLAGGVAVLVVTLVVAALGFPPFDVGEAFAFGLLVAPCAFAGQILASVMLPHARAFAPALRRVDSLLLTAPLWYVGIDLVVT
jgi:hypothetical protein